MLCSLYIKNAALISELTIELNRGLNILSGETGAGKSIIIDSLGFVLGEKADTALIKHGESLMSVQAVFTLAKNARIEAILEELGIEREELLILKRTLNISGKGEIHINGQTATAAMLKKLTSALVDIFGQSEHLSLLKVSNHIGIIDGFDKGAVLQKNIVCDLFIKYKNNLREIKSFGSDEGDRQRRLDLLSFQLNEIDDADIAPDEEEDLTVRRARIINTEKIVTSLSGALSALTARENDIVDTLSVALSALSAVLPFDGEIEKEYRRLTGLRLELSDAAANLESIQKTYDFSPLEADKIENRLQLIRGIKRKYGRTLEEIAAFYKNAAAEYERLSDSDEIIKKLKADGEKLKYGLYRASVKLNDLRLKNARALETRILTELNDLGLQGSRFLAQFEDLPSYETADGFFSSDGLDRVEFLFSANTGEPLRPLSKIISGGEMSRFMLAIKNITAQIENMPTMVFDEIDTGISGKMASAVAMKIARISRAYQCIVVTHQPAIAAMGDSNFLIVKTKSGNKTNTKVEYLAPAQKIKEIARLIGGRDISEHALPHAKEMIAWADSYKKT
jgi:DNA repair protein RecN (Recombination protein N)